MPPRQSRPTRAPVDRAAITAAATALLTEGGVEAVTMRSLASRLGVSAMALYHHVEDKDDVLRMVGDEVLGRVVLPDPLAMDWRAQIIYVVTHAYRALQSVPGISGVVLTSKLLPNAKAQLLFSLHQFERAGLDPAAAREAYAGVHQLFIGRLLIADSANFRLSSTAHAVDEIHDYIAVLHRESTFINALEALLNSYGKADS
ncbi:TetR/AcrR family transcriptional regulator [Mycolicibacterium anyangense]|uniref:TetR/AcrR family transcriptional regulator n=1 Tax=Mycolicibacterium anyangense TaxID=1431246 RepID=UPI0013D3751B|nr:TetR/AcrR family transcriptional regulator [Mycolicibacterium anyangense]